MNLTTFEPGSERQSWMLAALASVALHGLLFGSSFWFLKEPPKPKKVTVQQIFLADNIPDAVMSSPQPRQASPRQLEAPVKPVPPKPKPKPRRKVISEPSPEVPPSLAMARPGPVPSPPAARGRPTSAPQGPGGGTGVGPHLTDFGSASGPAFLRRVSPVYPEQARRRGQEGKVLLRLTIDERGNLQKVEVLEGAGFGFEAAAVEAVKRSSFRPASIEGKPVPSIARLPIRFVLRN
ncbi:MAG: TonB family protein [Thermodesulfobacteriota bacterium]